MTLRTDVRSWLIDGDEQFAAMRRALEVYALSTKGQQLARHPDVRVRAVGSLMVRLGETQGREMMDGDGAGGVAVRWLSLLACHVSGVPHDEVLCARALDELHGLAVQLDHRADSAGRRHPGVLGAMVRGD